MLSTRRRKNRRPYLARVGDLGGRVVHRAKRRAALLAAYFVITKLVGPRVRPIRWTWEIRRRSGQLGVKYDGEEYATAQDARLAGEKALNEFLNDLGQR